MKLSHIALALAAFTLAPSAFAGSILTVEAGAKSLDNVNVSKGGKLAVADRSINLITMGAGIRTATLGIHAYEGEVLVSDNNKYDCKGGAFASLKDESAVAIRINVLFSFGKSKLSEALNAGFDANGVDASKDEIVQLLAAIEDDKAPDAPRGDVIVFAGEKLADGSEVVTYENAGKAGSLYVKSIKGGAGFIKSVMGLWLGKTDDSGLKNLNKNLTTCQIQ